MKVKTSKLSEENIKEYLCDLGVEKHVWSYRGEKSINNNGNQINSTTLKNRSFCTKELWWLRSQVIDWEKSAQHIKPTKGQHIEYTKNFYKSMSKGLIMQWRNTDWTENSQNRKFQLPIHGDRCTTTQIISDTKLQQCAIPCHTQQKGEN